MFKVREHQLDTRYDRV